MIIRLNFLLITIISAAFAEDGFWSRGLNSPTPTASVATSGDHTYYPQGTSAEAPGYLIDSSEEEEELTSKHLKYKTATAHINGLVDDVLPDLPNNINNLHGVMDEVAGLLFHSTPLSSPASESEPEFHHLKDLKPKNLDKKQAYGFKKATKKDTDTLQLMALLAGYYGAYFKVQHQNKKVDAQLLIDTLHLQECNPSFVGDYEMYLTHVAYMLRLVEAGVGRKLSWYGTLYGDHRIDQGFLSTYLDTAKEGAKSYQQAIATGKKYEYVRKYRKVLGDLGLRVNAHNKDAMIKSTEVKANFEHLSVLSEFYKELMQKMSGFERLLHTESLVTHMTLTKLKQQEKIDKDIDECSALLETMLTSVKGFYSLEQRQKKDLKDSQWKKENELLGQASELLKELDRFIKVSSKNVNAVIDEILSDKKIKQYVTRDDVWANIKYLILRYGSFERAKEKCPNVISKLSKQYAEIAKVLSNPKIRPYLNEREKYNNMFARELDKYCEGGIRIYCNFYKNSIFILPRYIYKLPISYLRLQNTWLPEPGNPTFTTDWRGGIDLFYEDEMGSKEANIVELPDCWSALQKLDWLSLRHSLDKSNGYCCEQLPKSFNKMTALSDLRICHMGIKEVPKCFKYMKKLTSLSIIGNPFAEKVSVQDCLNMKN